MEVEKIARFTAILFGTCYVLGLLIVNLYLLKLGISEFTLFKVRYIFIGIIGLLPIFISLVFVLLALKVYEKISFSSNVNNNNSVFLKNFESIFFSFFKVVAVTLCLSFPIIVIYIMSISFGFPINQVSNLIPPNSFSVYISSVIICFFCLIQFRTFNKINSKNKKITKFSELNIISGTTIVNFISEKSLLFFYYTPSLILLILYLFIISSYESNIPEQLGGLKSKKVKILFLQDNLQDLYILKLNLDSNSNLSKEMELYFETESYYILKNIDTNVLWIDKKMVNAIEIVK